MRRRRGPALASHRRSPPRAATWHPSSSGDWPWRAALVQMEVAAGGAAPAARSSASADPSIALVGRGVRALARSLFACPFYCKSSATTSNSSPLGAAAARIRM